MLPIIVTSLDSNSQKKALLLAKKLGLSFQDSISGIDSPCLVLEVSSNHLQIRFNDKKMHPFFVNFLDPKLLHRAQQQEEGLLRAIGIKKNYKPQILDLTAGFGRDAFVLASQGCTVLMLERHPVVAALLADGLQRAQEVLLLKDIRLELIEKDAISFLKRASTVEVIYFDPMYPIQKKEAAVKKEMQLLRALVGTEEDTMEVFSLALIKANKRLVVKRPRVGSELKKPDLVITGRANRFDVYLINKN